MNDTIPFHLFSFYTSAFQHVTFNDLFLKWVLLIAVDIFSKSSKSFHIGFLVLFQQQQQKYHFASALFKSKKPNSLFWHSPSWFICWLDGLFARKYQNLAWFILIFIIIRLSIFIIIMTLSVLILHLLLFTVITIVLTLNFRNPSCIIISSQVEFDWPETHKINWYFDFIHVQIESFVIAI